MNPTLHSGGCCQLLSIRWHFCQWPKPVADFVGTVPVYRGFLCRFCPRFVLLGGTKKAKQNKDLRRLETWPRGLRRRFAKPIHDNFHQLLNHPYFNYLDRERGRSRDAAVPVFVPALPPENEAD